MFLPRLAPSKFLVPGLVVATVLASVHLAQAKRGCAAFGHSCFGGHGKRSDSSVGAVEADEAPSGLQPPADDLRPFVVGDASRTPTDNLSRDQLDNDVNLIMSSQYQPEDYLRLSPPFRKWLANSYRRGDLLALNN